MNHPAILQFIGFSPTNFQQENKPVIITELSSNGPLSDIIDYENRGLSIPGWDYTKKLITIFGIASGMSYLHFHNIIHRDLKPENVLTDDRLFPEISDFGFSKKISNSSSMSLQSITALKGTPSYLSPEIIERQEYTKAGDVYAFGIIVYEIMMAQRAYDGFDLFKLYKAITNGERPSIDDSIPLPYQELIEKCWSQDPESRPTFEEIVDELQNDEFITELIDENDYRSYIEFINEYQSTFDKSKRILKIEDLIQNKQSKSFQKVSIIDFINQQKPNLNDNSNNSKILPAKFFNELFEKSQKIVEESYNDPDTQYLVGTYLIEGKNGFPRNIEYGFKYLERSNKNGCLDSALYLSEMYQKGDVIPQDVKKSKEYLLNYENADDGRIYNELGKMMQSEGKIDDARKYFDKGAKKYNPESMFAFGRILILEISDENADEGLKLIKLSKNQGYNQAESYLNIHNKMIENHSFLDLPLKIQLFFVNYMIENGENKIKIDENHMKILFDCNLLDSPGLIEVFKSFSEVCVELTFPSDFFTSTLAQLSKYKDDHLINISLFISVSPSVTLIRNGAFDGCSFLTQISIPSTVTEIGNHAFSGCSSLKQITIPSSVTEIGYNSFRGCSSLTQIAIPSSVTSASHSTFDGCSSLTQITIPSSITFIGSGAFFGCSSLTQITIPSSVTSIGLKAFCECSSLTQISIPSISTISEYLFSKCKSLTQITIPSSVTSIGERAFYGCSSLEKITIPSSVTSIGKRAFYECSSLEKITIPSSVTSIGVATFCGCSSLTEITIPSSVTSIEDSAFNRCSSLTEITIPSSVTSIRYSTFFGCSSLTQITILSNVTEIGGLAFLGCSSLEKIIIPSSVTSIGKRAFYECSSLEKITIPSSVTSIGKCAFFGCKSLKQIDIPSSVTSLKGVIFCGCSSLAQITIPSSVTSIGKRAFRGCLSLEKITIPSSVTSIGESAFYNCMSLTQIVIPSSVTSLESEIFGGCSSLVQITIPSSVTIIGPSAFKGCSRLTQITIPSSVTEIGNNAFSGCRSLKKVVIPSSVTSIGDSCFYGCSSLMPFKLPPTVTSVGKGIFDKTLCSIQ